MKLLIDIGNTRSKLAVADGDGIVHQEILSDCWTAALDRLHSRYSIERTVVSCVGADGPALQQVLEERGEKALWLKASTPCGISNVPEGYGADRLAADIAAYNGQSALLVIDAGTCITYDLILDGRLAGGVISPGVQLRLDAMHSHTAALPAIDAHTEKRPGLMANDTRGCMLSAAIHGAEFEVEGYVRRLRDLHPHLDIILTGGQRIALPADIPHTYDPQLVLKGLMKL